MANTPTKLPSLPDLSGDPSLSQQLRSWVAGVTMWLNVRESRLPNADPLDRVLTVRDLGTENVSKIQAGTIGSGAQGPMGPMGPTGPAGAGVVTDLTPPPALTGVAVVTTITSVICTYDQPAYVKLGTSESNHARTEVWLADAAGDGSSPGFGAAKKMGESSGPVIYVPLGATGRKVYVWLQNVSRADVAGPRSGGVEGLVAQTGKVGNSDLTDGIVTAAKLANGQITPVKFSTGTAPVFMGPTNPTLPNASYPAGTIFVNTTNSKVYRANAAGDAWTNQTDGADIAAGTIAASRLIANTITAGSGVIADAAITNAMVSNLSADKITFGTMSGDRLAVNTITADKFVANLFQTDNVLTRGLTVRDASGNIILGAGTSLNWANIAGQPANIYNTNISIGADGTLNGAGGGQVTRQPVIDAGVGSSTFGKRSRDDAPSEYAVGLTLQFKDGFALGIGSTANFYGTLETSKPYPDNTGGMITQFFYASSGETWKRYGRPADSSWIGSWVQDLDRRSYTGDLDATKGAPAGTLVAGVSADTVATAATNFNASNDRNAGAVTAPTIAADGTAVDHAMQTDGSADISFEWSWGGSEGDIDGFHVFVYQAATSSAYAFGTSPSAETVFQVPAARRAFVLYGVAADRYYTFGVRAYRAVDKDIAASGVIQSAIVKPSLAAENPYQPSTSVAFSGNVTGTIDGLPTSAVKNSSISIGADGTLIGAGGGQVTRQPVVDAGNGSATFGQRSRNDAPSEYSVGLTLQFKDGYALGIGSTANFYGTLETSKPYGDNTGGMITQYFYAGSGETWKRYGRPADSSWIGSWVLDLDRRSYTGDLNATFGAAIGVNLTGAWAQATWDAAMPSAYIRSAHISGLTVDKLLAGALAVGQFIQSTNYSAGVSGWRINADGTAEFGPTMIRGKLTIAQVNYAGTAIDNGQVTLSASGGTIQINGAGGGSATGVVMPGNPITSVNVGTYIDNLAIGAAQIGSISLVGTSNFSVKTATSGARQELTGRAIKIFDATGTLRVRIGDLSA